jgi:hypothetical protein
MSARAKIVKSLVTKLNEIAATQKFSTAGSAAPTFGNLLDLFNASLRGATASLDGNNDLRITNATPGSTSKIALRDIGSRRLFSNLSGYVKIKNAVDGTDPTNGYQRIILSPSSTEQTDLTGLNASTTYTATVTMDGIANSVSILGSDAYNYNALVNKVESLVGGCTVKFLGSSGKIEIKSTSTGTSSSVSIVDTGTNKLFNSLTHYASIPAAIAGMDATVGYQVVELSGTPTESSFTTLMNLDSFIYTCEVKVPNVYLCDLYQNVTDKLVFWDEIVDFPFVGITAGNETREYLPGAFKWGYLTLTVRIYVQEEDPVLALENVLYEVERKIEENSDLGYGTKRKVADLRIISITTDEGLLAPIGVGEFQLQAQYEI